MFRRHFFLVFAAVVLVGLTAVGAWRLTIGKPESGGGRGPGGGAGRAAAVTPYTVAARDFTNRIELLGAAKANQSITVTSNTAELVSRVRFSSGQPVRAGQTLVELNARQEQANIATARSAVEKARLDYERYATLGQRGYAPRALIEQYRAVLQQAQSELAAQQATQLDRLIRAPFSGVVGLSDVAPGQLISPGTPIVSLDDLSLVKVDFQAPERYLSVLRQGLPVQARADAYPDEVFNGRIALLDTRVDAATRALTARAEFPNPGGRIKPGMLLRVQVSEGARSSPAVPESAIEVEAEIARVFVIAQAPPGGGRGGPGGGQASGESGERRRGGQAPAAAQQGPRLVAQRRTVTTGARENGFVEITAGLKPGDRIVLDGLNRLQPNQPVRLAGARPPGQPAGGGAAAQGRAAPSGAG